MRNLKRALSMAMASVMLMGMSVVGTSAASVSDFSDVDSINNKEAVAIATGLGIFDGYDDGEFKPEKVVTRAEMAVVIAKILHGSDVDPSNFVGANKFTDVPAWAEGYVNLVASLGIIVGVGDGKFAPNQTVTTAEASTMLLKALGYYTAEGDALGKDWDLQATSKATALGFYGDLSLKMNEGLTREDVAELTFNALFAQRVAFDDVRGLHVKANDRNVVVTNGTDDETNTLAQNTYGLYSAEGIVVANGMTDESLAASLKSVEMTTLKFTEDTDLNHDGKVEYSVGDVVDFKVETGLDMIGHAAKVYYKIEKKAPVVFAIVDQAELVAEITNNGNSTKLANAANAAGFKKNTILNIPASDYIVNYDMETTLSDLTASVGGTDKVTWINDTESNIGATLDASKKLILISNEADLEVNYVIVLDQYLDTVKDIDKDDDETDYKFTSNDGRDLNVVVGDVEEKDYIIVTDIGNQGHVLVAEAAPVENADVTKIIAKSAGNGGNETTGVVADGTTYSKSLVLPHKGATDLDDTVAFVDVDKIGNYGLVLDFDGKMIAMVTEPAAPNYAYVAQYGYYYGKTANDVSAKNVLTALVYFADGTSGVYDVDIDDSDLGSLNMTNAGVSTTVSGLNGAADELFAQSKGIWNVKVQSDNSIRILNAAWAGDDALTAGNTAAFNAGTTLVKGHSTLLDSRKANVVYASDRDTKIIYNNNDTVYFYVNGEYDASAADNGLTVVAVTGIKNAKGFKNDDPAGSGSGIKDLWIKDGARNVVKVVGIEDVVVGGAEGVYYYDTNKYEVEKVEGGYVINYTVYDVNGEAQVVTYNNSGKFWKTSADAYDHGKSKPDGFYKLGAKDLEAYVNTNLVNWTTIGAMQADKTYNIYATKSDVNYVVNAVAQIDPYTDNLFDATTLVGTIADKAKYIDMTGNGLNSLAKIADAIEDGDKVYISYRYDNEKYDAAIIYVSDYVPAGTAAPGTSNNRNSAVGAAAVSRTTVTLTPKAGYTLPAKVDWVIRSFSGYTGTWTVVKSGTANVTTTGTVSTVTIDDLTNYRDVAPINFELQIDGVVATGF